MAFFPVAPPAFGLANSVSRSYGYGYFSVSPTEFSAKVLSQLQSFRKAHHFRATLVAQSVSREVYQPFRPPVVPGSDNLSVDQQLEALRDRRGLWFEYAVHVPTLIRAGFTPSIIEESTGMAGIEQNKIVVASQVRSSLQSSGMDEATIRNFDVGGVDILYELRILTTDERKSAAEFALERRMDPKECRDLARAMKDYERRKREEGWSSFTYTPADCIAFSCYRLSKELNNEADRESLLKRGLDYAISDKARDKIKSLLEKREEMDEQIEDVAMLQVVRLSMTEVGTNLIPYLMPVVGPSVQELETVPAVKQSGPFAIREAKTPWKAWVALPPWDRLAASLSPVAISYPNAHILPWKPKNKQELEEPIIVVVDKGCTQISEGAYFMVEVESRGLALQLGSVAAETASRPLGKVLLALRPPLPEVDESESIEWD